MVLSGAWKTTYHDSMVNRPQGGGPKKAGTPPVTNVPDSVYNAYVTRGDGILSLVNMRTNRFKRHATQNLPMNMVHSHAPPMR